MAFHHVSAAVFVLALVAPVTSAGLVADDGTAPVVTTDGLSHLVPPLLGEPDVALRERGPIVIDGDADLCEDKKQSGVINCETATGCGGEPYLISGWLIRVEVGTLMPAIRLSNTTLCVVVSGNEFVTPASDGSPTVVLLDVSNVKFESNKVLGGRSTAFVAEGFRGEHAAIAGNVFSGAIDRDVPADLVRIRDAPGLRFTGNNLSTLPGLGYGASSLVDVAGAAPGALFERNYYHNASANALAVSNSNGVRIVEERFYNVTRAMRITDSWTPVVSSLRTDLVAAGLSASNVGTLTVSDSIIYDGHPCQPACFDLIGIAVMGSSLDVTRTLVDGFDTGVFVDAVAPHWLKATCITVEANGVGISTTNLGAGNVSDSNIMGNTDAGFRNVGTSMLQAKQNWWNHPDGPTLPDGPLRGDRVEGKVNPEQHLSAESACAPS